MTTEQFLAIVEDRGLSIYVKNGQPIIYADDESNNEEITPKLLRVLPYHRERIIELLTKQGTDA